MGSSRWPNRPAATISTRSTAKTPPRTAPRELDQCHNGHSSTGMTVNEMANGSHSERPGCLFMGESSRTMLRPGIQRSRMAAAGIETACVATMHRMAQSPR